MQSARVGRAPGPFKRQSQTLAAEARVGVVVMGGGGGPPRSWSPSRARREFSPDTPRPTAQRFFFFELKNQTTTNTRFGSQLGKKKTRDPGTPSPRGARGEARERAARLRDPVALPPAPARAEKFARPRAPRTPGCPAPGRVRAPPPSSRACEARAQRGAWEREPRPPGPP